jgi:hypothetical protein
VEVGRLIKVIEELFSQKNFPSIEALAFGPSFLAAGMAHWQIHFNE